MRGEANSRFAAGRHRRLWAIGLVVAFLSLFLFVAAAPAAPVTITIPFSTTPVIPSDLDGNPATGAWSDAGNWTIPLENGASAPYGSAHLYAKHDNSSVYFRIDGYADTPWQSATGSHFWLGMQISPTGTSHHTSGTWEGVFFGLWDGSSYSPTPTYPPHAVETTGFGKPPSMNATQSDTGTMAYTGSAAPYAFTAEWRRPLNAGGLPLVADGSTSYHFFVTTETNSNGAAGGNIQHGQITNVNVMRLASAGGGTPPPPVTPPAVSITSPAANAVVNGVVTIAATASSSAGIARVEFDVDSALIGTATSTPYTANWDTTSYANGAHQLTAKAYDPSGNVGTASLSVRVDHTARSVSITSPVDHAVISGRVTINVSATDPGGVDRVDFFLNQTTLGSSAQAPYFMVWDTASVSEGFYGLRAMASFTTGGALNATVHVLVDRIPAPAAPTVTDEGGSSLRVTWAVSPDAFVTGYLLFRSGRGSGPFVQLNVNPVQNTTYLDAGLVPGGSYYYEIEAVDVWGHPSPPSPAALGVAGAGSIFDFNNLRWAALPAAMALILVLIIVLVRRELRQRSGNTRSASRPEVPQDREGRR